MSVFSPLALTQALPFLPLAQGDIDYEVSRRDEPDLFDTALLEPDTKVILVKDGMVAVPRGQGAIADYANVHMRLAQLPGAYVAAELHTHPTALAIFLGSYGGKRDEHVVAVDVSRVKAAETVAASSEHMGADDAFGEQHEPGSENVEIVAGKRCGTIRLGRSARIRTACQRARSRPGHDGDLAGRMACAPTSLPHMRRSDRTGVGRMGATLRQRSGRQATAVPQSGTGRHHGDRGP